jgi:acetyltransferase-like isoleucine patch superfamily enzyme
MLLSICIPTRNRAETLRASLISIVSQKEFANRNDIEIVVSDNASTDCTQRIVDSVAQNFRSKIIYKRNLKNKFDRNFEIALNHGRGDFLKLANDSLQWQSGSLAKLIDVVEATKDTKPQLVFTNTNAETDDLALVKNADELLKSASYHLTWIGSFGIWKSDLDELDNFSRYASLQLVVVDVAMRFITKKQLGIIDNRLHFKVIEHGAKHGYNIAQVFGTNYLHILNQFSDYIKCATMIREKERVLISHILPYYYDDRHDFDRSNIKDDFAIYRKEHYFQNYLKSADTNYQCSRRTRQVSDWLNIWRSRNPHNETTIANIFDFRKVSVGRASYGSLLVFCWDHKDEKLKIGRYVSIANGVSFILGGNHSHSGITTFPVKVKLLGETVEAQTKGQITVGDDVWIGQNATIMSGVTIGQGAVIGAEAVVSKDVPAYTIVAGNPARVVKRRFSTEATEKFTRVNYEKILPSDLRSLGEDLYHPENHPKFDYCLKILQQLSLDAPGNL